jgi:hypothetical protein
MPQVSTSDIFGIILSTSAGNNYYIIIIIINWWESQKERDHWEDQDVGGWTILKWILET